MMAQIQSLGDGSKAKMRLAHEERPLPQSRKELVSLFSEVLELGFVQKVLIEVGKPLKFARLVPLDELPLQSEPPPTEAPSEDLFEQIMSARIIEASTTAFGLPTDDLLQVLVTAFAHIAAEKLKPVVFTTHSLSVVQKHLGLQGTLFDSLLGVPIKEEALIPSNVLVLSAADDEGVITLSIRMLIELTQSRKTNETNR